MQEQHHNHKLFPRTLSISPGLTAQWPDRVITFDCHLIEQTTSTVAAVDDDAMNFSLLSAADLAAASNHRFAVWPQVLMVVVVVQVKDKLPPFQMMSELTV